MSEPGTSSRKQETGWLKKGRTMLQGRDGQIESSMIEYLSARRVDYIHPEDATEIGLPEGMRLNQLGDHLKTLPRTGSQKDGMAERLAVLARTYRELAPELEAATERQQSRRFAFA